MSHLWRDRVRIALSPRRAVAVRLGGGLRPKILDYKVVDCAGGDAERPWMPALDALRGVLALPRIAGAIAAVILSDHFVHYLLVPWNPEVVTEQEEIAFAKAHFLRVYGAASQDWAIRLSDGNTAAQRVASAIEQPLLDALSAMLPKYHLRLCSIQPHLMTAFNAWGGRQVRDGWLAIAEPGRLLLGLRRGGEWISLRSRPLNGAATVSEIIAQERRLLGLEASPERVFLHAADGVTLDTAGVRAERLALDENASASRGADALRLALCGIA